MKPEELDAILARADAATPPPIPCPECGANVAHAGDCATDARWSAALDALREAAENDVPALVADNRKLRALLTEAADAIHSEYCSTGTSEFRRCGRGPGGLCARIAEALGE